MVIKNKICIVCKKNLKHKLSSYCLQCKNNKALEYHYKNKEKRNKISRDYYYKNRETEIQRIRKHQIKTNYKSEKTPYQRKIRNIKRATRYKYPLKNQKCIFCGRDATEHHHTTKPIKIHKFSFCCHQCHIQAERHYKGANKIKWKTKNKIK